MSHKKYVKHFLLISIFIICFIPLINIFMLSFKNNLSLKSFDSNILYNTDEVEKYFNYTIYKVFNKTLVTNRVIAGKDGFLFLGNRSGKIIDKLNGKYRPSLESIDSWTDKLKNLQAWYENRGIKFVIVIAPNKHVVYKENLPNWLQYNGQIITDDIVEFANKKNIHMLDLRQILIHNKILYSDLLYYKTDTHWNRLGASIAYKETIRYLNSVYNTNYKTTRYTLDYKMTGGKDLAKLLKFDMILPDDYEKEILLKFERNQDICIGKIDKVTHKLNECKNINNPRVSVVQNPSYTNNHESINSDKLLFICDSFASNHSKLYNLTFSTIWRFHHDFFKIQKFFNLKNKPDIVIYQIAERNLFNQEIVQSFTNIMQISDKEKLKYPNILFDISNEQNTFDKNDHFTIQFKSNDLDLKVIRDDPIMLLKQIITASKNVILSYALESTKNTTFQIFYRKDKNSHYNKTDSYIFSIKKGNNKLNLRIPSKYINNGLRVDLVSTVGEYKIKEFKIYEE